MKLTLERKKQLRLWYQTELMTARGDLAVLPGVRDRGQGGALCDDELIWFADPADPLNRDVAQLLAEWKRELVVLVRKAAAAKARAAREGA